MFQGTKRLASGNGTVAYHYEGGAYHVTVWTEETDRYVAVETLPIRGEKLEDRRRAEAAAKAKVAEYAAAH